MKYCAWLYEIGPTEETRWGKEAVSLAEIARTGVPVLPGFVIGREGTFAYFNDLNTRSFIQKTMREVSLNKPTRIAAAAKDIRTHILKTELPAELRRSFASFLEELENQLLIAKGGSLELVLTSQTTPHHTVHGTVKNLAEADHLFRKLLTFFFEERALHDRLEKEDVIVPAAFPVLVQHSRPVELSGTLSCTDPSTADETVTTVVVTHHEHGNHEHATEGDIYRFDAKTNLLLSKEEGEHHWSAKKTGHRSPKRTATVYRAREDQLERLAKMAKRAQAPFPELQKMSWVYSEGQLFINAVEPFKSETEVSESGARPLLWGIVGSLGTVSGPIRHLFSAKDLSRLQDGDIVVVEHLSDATLPSLAGVGGIICESGHAASSEARVARRLGVPAVLGVAHAHTALKEGHVVTLDGSHGVVYAGVYRPHEIPAFTPSLPTIGTKLYVTIRDLLEIPQGIEQADGIGVLRSEQILDMLGAHPHDIVRKGVAEEYISILSEGIERVARAVYPRPVVYQLHDIGSQLITKTGKHEPNPMLGFRGAHRLLAEPETLELELEALDRIAKKGLDNLYLMVPMVRSLPELHTLTARFAQLTHRFELPPRLWVRCETPALAIQAEEVAKSGVYGVLFDLPALTSLIVGIDHHNFQIGHHANHADDAVLQAIEYAIAVCHEHGIVTSIISEGEMLAAEAVEVAVNAGVTAVTVEPAYAASTRGLLASIEQRMLMNHVLESATSEEKE